MSDNYLDDIVQKIKTTCDISGFVELSVATKAAIKDAQKLARAYKRTITPEQRLEMEALKLAQMKSAEVTSWNTVLKERERATIAKSNETISWNRKLQNDSNNATRLAMRTTMEKISQDRLQQSVQAGVNAQTRFQTQLSRERVAQMRKEIAEQRRLNRERSRNGIGLGSRIGTYLGAYFGIHTVRNILETYRSLDLTRRSIEGLTQSTQDWEYIQKEAFRTATDIEVVAKGYRNFYSAASMAGVEKSGVQNMYSGILEAGRAVGASQTQIQGALLALEQMFSKGRVSMEELRKQLGNALPGAMEVAAKAMGVTSAEFNELIKKGIQATDLVPRFTEEYRKTFAKSFPEAMKSLDAALVNLSNSWKLFQYDLLKGEGGKELARLIVTISKTLQSPSLKQAISNISKGLSIIFDILRYIAMNIQTIMWLLAPIIIGSFLTKMWDLVKAIYAMATGLNVAQVSLYRIFLLIALLDEILAFFTDREGLLERAIMGKDQSWIERLIQVGVVLGGILLTFKSFGGSLSKLGTGVKGAAVGVGTVVASKSKGIAKNVGSFAKSGVGKALGWTALWAELANIGNQQIYKMGINPMSVSPYGFAQPMNFGTPILDKTETNAPTINYEPKYEINATNMTPEQLKAMLDERDRNFWMSLLNPATMLLRGTNT